MMNPFSNALGTVADVEILDWLEVAERLAAGPMAGDALLAEQIATVKAEATARRLIGGPAKLTARERREMGEGQE